MIYKQALVLWESVMSIARQMQVFSPCSRDIRWSEPTLNFRRQNSKMPTLKRAKVGYITEIIDAQKENPRRVKQQGNHIKILQYIIEMRAYSNIQNKFYFFVQKATTVARFCLMLLFGVLPSFWSQKAWDWSKFSSVAIKTKRELQMKKIAMLMKKQICHVTPIEISKEVRRMARTSPIVPRAAQKLMKMRSE